MTSITETVQNMEAQVSVPDRSLLLVSDKSGLFLTSFDHDDDDEEEGEVGQDHDVTTSEASNLLNLSAGEGQLPSSQVKADQLLDIRLVLQDRVSHLLDTVLRPAAEPPGGQSPHLARAKRDHVEQVLVKRITEVIDKTLADEDTDSTMALKDSTMLLKDSTMLLKDRTMLLKDSGHEEQEEVGGMSMALVRADRSDCESCGGDLSEHENVYDVFDLRKEQDLFFPYDY